jgi:carbon monoxide dehydrogenase subunit G
MRPSIRFDDEMILAMSRDRAWDLLTDPRVVVSCVPGAKVTSIDADGTIHGALKLSLGPSETQFEGRIVPTFDHEAHTGELTGQGSDGKGRTRAAIKTSFKVEEDALDTSRFTITSEIAVSGALAGFATAGGQAVAKRLLMDFSQHLGQLGDPKSDLSVSHDEAPTPERLGVIGLLFRTLWDAIRRLFVSTDSAKIDRKET